MERHTPIELHNDLNHFVIYEPKSHYQETGSHYFITRELGITPKGERIPSRRLRIIPKRLKITASRLEIPTRGLGFTTMD